MRYTELELPIEPYIPGKNKRPHFSSYKLHNRPATSIQECRGDKNRHLLYGIDLFNNGYYWEAHEAWEDLCRIEENREFRAVLQGLIQITGGAVKLIQGNSNGVIKLWTSAMKYLKVGSIPICELDIESILKEINNRLTNSVNHNILMAHTSEFKIYIITHSSDIVS